MSPLTDEHQPGRAVLAALPHGVVHIKESAAHLSTRETYRLSWPFVTTRPPWRSLFSRWRLPRFDEIFHVTHLKRRFLSRCCLVCGQGRGLGDAGRSIITYNNPGYRSGEPSRQLDRVHNLTRDAIRSKCLFKLDVTRQQNRPCP